MSRNIASDIIVSEMENIIRNPKAVVRVTLDLLERITNGEQIVVDGSNAFAYSLVMGAVNSSVGLIQAESLGRRLYPSMAKTDQDAYLHMADIDYLDRFVRPGMCVLGFVMPLEEVIGKATPLNDGSGARQLIIPRHTSVTVGSSVLTLQYPIIIKVLYNNTITASMDLTNKSPLYIPSTNILKHAVAIDGNNRWLVIDFPAQQVAIASHVIQVTAHSGYAKQFTHEDNFCYARAYLSTSDGRWREIATTHQDQVYNPNRPTVCLKVLNRSVEAYIPQIYFQNGTITGNIRLDIYTSRGVINEDLTTYDAATPKIKIQDLDMPLTHFSTPFNTFSALFAIPRTPIAGGRGAITFTELINRIRTRSTFTEGLPITTNQLGSSVRDLGFELNTKIDNITDRQYAAVREIDPPKNQTTVTGLGCSMQLVQFNLNDLKVSPIVFESTKRAVIKPAELFVQSGNGLKILDDATVSEMRALAQRSPDAIANLVNGTQYYFTPFHYILDMGLRTFNVRPYLMSTPKAKSRYLIQQNVGLGLDIISDGYQVEYLDTGYRFTFNLKNTQTLNILKADQLSVQASYLVSETNTRGFIAGELITPIDKLTGRPVGDNWTYSITMTTDFDIDRQHRMTLNETGLAVSLLQEFDLVFVVKNYTPDSATLTDIDVIISKQHIVDYDYNAVYYGATQERIALELGTYLDNLWRRSRTIIQEGEYRRYDKDIYDYWPADEYEKDATGYPTFTYDEKTGVINLNKLHTAGDPVLDGKGNPVIRYHKGHIMYDQDNRPVPIKNIYELARELDMFFVDGRYYFATDAGTVDYLSESLDTISNWMGYELRTMERRCLERTDVYYYPKMTSGLIDVVVGDGEMARLKADQSIVIRYVMRKEKYRNAEIRESLTKRTPGMLMNAFKILQRNNGGILTSMDIRSYIKRLVQDDVVNVIMSGFLNDQFEAALATDVSNIPTLGKKLVPLSNLTLQVQDDVSVDFEILDSDKITPYTANTK